MRRLQITGLILVSLAALAVCGPTGYRLAAAATPDGAGTPIIEQMPYASPYRAPVTSPAPSIGTGGAVVSQTGNIVRIADFAFNPPSISVPAGTTVTWTNAGPSTHTTTADNGLWNSGPLRPGASFVQSFMSPGTFTYHCMIHPVMTGSITVTPSSTVAGPSSSNLSTVSVSAGAGWDLFAGPAGTTITGSNGPLYTLRAGDTTYETVAPGAPLLAGTGYWAYFNGPVTESLPIAGSQPTSMPLPIGQWVMVGNPSSGAVNVSGSDSLLTYSSAQGYQPATTLMPGQGAWAFSSAGGVLMMTGG